MVESHKMFVPPPNHPFNGAAWAMRQHQKEREYVAEALLRARLPRQLQGLLKRPRALKLALRLRPMWKPTFIQLQGYTTLASAQEFGQAWLRETAERGNTQANVGVIYSQADARQRAIAVHA